MTLVKICGLSTPETYAAARSAGADLVGFVFYPPSPRAVAPAQAGAIGAPGGPLRVGLFVDPTDDDLATAIGPARLDMLQLHGAEPPARVAEVQARFGLKVIKVFGIGTAEDVAAAAAPHPADWLMLDAKPAALPGGNAQPFDWDLLANVRFDKSWLLAGGLTPETVGQAIATARPTGVDVSSGVERARGIKDESLMTRFIAAAKAA
jgi:phosphoribosylanthranilate isomerase